MKISNVTKIIIVAIIATVINTSWQFLKRTTPDINEESIATLESTIKLSKIPSIVSDSFHRLGIFAYIDNYSQKYLLAGTNLEGTSNPSMVIGDVFYEEAYRYHKHKLCFVMHTIDIPTSSKIYTLLKDYDEIFQDSYIASCPIYLNDKLIGYVGSVFAIKNRLFNEVQALKVITDEVEDEFKHILYGNDSP